MTVKECMYGYVNQFKSFSFLSVLLRLIHDTGTYLHASIGFGHLSVSELTMMCTICYIIPHTPQFSIVLVLWLAGRDTVHIERLHWYM